MEEAVFFFYEPPRVKILKVNHQLNLTIVIQRCAIFLLVDFVVLEPRRMLGLKTEEQYLTQLV